MGIAEGEGRGQGIGFVASGGRLSACRGAALGALLAVGPGLLEQQAVEKLCR
ncbi:MAG: hypothetical protein QXU62_05795 [Thermofilaceae archaeon]